MNDDDNRKIVEEAVRNLRRSEKELEEPAKKNMRIAQKRSRMLEMLEKAQNGATALEMYKDFPELRLTAFGISNVVPLNHALVIEQRKAREQDGISTAP